MENIELSYFSLQFFFLLFYQCGTFVKIDEPISILYYQFKYLLYIHFSCCTQVLTNVIYLPLEHSTEQFTALKFPWTPFTHPLFPLLSSVATSYLLLSPQLCLFHNVMYLQSYTVAFSDWLSSLSNMHLRISMSFHGLSLFFSVDRHLDFLEILAKISKRSTHLLQVFVLT